jgi:hypothetical protein
VVPDVWGRPMLFTALLIMRALIDSLCKSLLIVIGAVIVREIRLGRHLGHAVLDRE